jgi:hypothetical protein
MVGFAKITALAAFALLAIAAPVRAQQPGPKLEELSSIKGPNAAQIAVKRSLRVGATEYNVGAPAAQVPTNALLSTLSASDFKPGLATLCPIGSKDNQARADCRIVAVANAYNVDQPNMARWVAESKAQLIGNAAWTLSPANQQETFNFLLRNVTALEPAFDACIERLSKSAEASAESCFKGASRDEAYLLAIRLCYGQIKAPEGDLDVVSSISTAPSYCAVDPKSGLVVTLKLEEGGSRIGVAITSLLPIYELAARSRAMETQQRQQNYTPPRL